jgi:hypothetical protein
MGYQYPRGLLFWRCVLLFEIQVHYFTVFGALYKVEVVN